MSSLIPHDYRYKISSPTPVDKEPYKEGEGNQSLDDWREGHQAFFTEALAECNQVFDENMLIVCEEFKVIWK